MPGLGRIGGFDDSTPRWSGALASLARVHDQHLEATRTMHALDPAELDVTSGARTADPGQRPSAVERSHRVRYPRHDLLRAHHDEVEVRYQGQRAPALTGPGVQDDGARERDRDRAGRYPAVKAIEAIGA